MFHFLLELFHKYKNNLKRNKIKKFLTLFCFSFWKISLFYYSKKKLKKKLFERKILWPFSSCSTVLPILALVSQVTGLIHEVITRFLGPTVGRWARGLLSVKEFIVQNRLTRDDCKQLRWCVNFKFNSLTKVNSLNSRKNTIYRSMKRRNFWIFVAIWLHAY